MVPEVTEIPKTAAAPVDDRVLIVFEYILSLPAPVAIPVIDPALEILLMRLPVVALLVPVKLTDIAVIAPVLPVQLLKVLF